MTAKLKFTGYLDTAFGEPCESPTVDVTNATSSHTEKRNKHNLSLSDDAWLQLRLLAVQQGTTVSRVVEQLVLTHTEPLSIYQYDTNRPSQM